MGQDIFPKDVREAADKMRSDWIKSAEFEGEGMTLQLAKTMEKQKTQYGAEEGDFLVSQGILEVGESMLWTFNDKEGFERKYSSTSSPFFIGMKQVEELGVGDWVHIVRTGKTDKTRFTVKKVEVSQRKPKAEVFDDIRPEDVPF